LDVEIGGRLAKYYVLKALITGLVATIGLFTYILIVVSIWYYMRKLICYMIFLVILSKNVASGMAITRVCIRRKAFMTWIPVGNSSLFFFPFWNDQATIGRVCSAPRLPHQETEVIRGVINIPICAALCFLNCIVPLTQKWVKQNTIPL
jgi:hypothetical protein